MTQAMDKKHAVIVGLGKTGLSCARYFHARGRSFKVIDSRFSPPALAEFETEFPGAVIELGGFSQEALLQAGEIVLSPGISLQTPEIAFAISQGVPVTGDIDIFSHEVDAPVIAVTGSNGKSTVVTLVSEMARQVGIRVAVGGNLDGRASMPALDLLRSGERDLYILELSSFQLETTTRLNAEVAVILNLSEDHLDRYASMQDYAAAKQRIFIGARQVLVNRDDSASEPWLKESGRRWTYGMNEAVDEQAYGLLYRDGETWLMRGSNRLMPTREINLLGRHNVSNAMAALALGHAVGIPDSAMVTTLREFAGLPHRCQLLRNLRGVDYYNDSKGTNVGATLVAIESVAERTRGEIVLIAGGIGKDADFSPLLPALESYVKRVVLIGRDADKLARLIGSRADIMRATTMEEAVAEAASSAVDGDAVLLSPACASFDMFKDFAHRGRVFAAAVEALQ
ncbi:MAG: UDP-N-acetylmuramoyl-L-alanine--D-glutamate ligase [Pseudohongiella sp.]|uniref:UDP-N-acetylmuramoyl-L-alanine--D-glutamate ligase n=1 Tax=Pseudohongiella sp. TaxID=1979412 RepID=UPI0034A042A6